MVTTPATADHAVGPTANSVRSAHPSPAALSDVRARVMRRVDYAYLTSSGDVIEATRLVPALPPFDEAFAAFTRGTMLPTMNGHVAVEDLWPGMKVRVAGGRLEQLVWRGSTMVVPQGDRQDPAMTRLTRLSAEVLGLGRPYQDLVLGPRARLVNTRPGVRLLTGREAALIPAADCVDGVGIVEITPPAPVEVYHLGFERHELLLASGVEVESYHPGPLHAFPLADDLLSIFLGCFPHLPNLGGFGEPALPRLRLRDLDLFDAA